MAKTDTKKRGNFELYESFLGSIKATDTNTEETHAMTLRIPKEMNELIEQDLKLLQQTLRMKVSKRDFIIHMLLTALDYKEKEKKFSRIQNGASFKSFLELNRSSIINEMAKTRYWR